MNLLLLQPSELDEHGVARLTDYRATHVIRVLRAVPGQDIRVGIVDGALGTGRVIETTSNALTLSCTFESTLPPPARVDLLLALPRPKVMRRLWAQLAALGVGRVMLTNAERVERNYFDTHFLEPEVYRTLLIEGLQQARDTRVPAVSIHRRFRVLIEDELPLMAAEAQRIVADPSGTIRISNLIPPAAPCRVLLAVGPEGGWNRFELNLLRDHGFTTAGMGPRTLRADTACIALLALAHDALN